MSKIKNIIKKFKEYCSSFRVFDSKRIFPILSSFFLLILFGFLFYKFSFGRSVYVARYIASETETVAKILKDIDEGCNILSIRGDRCFVDFLTVKDFVGSEVGCLNLAHPKVWKGPYLNDNPAVNGILFEIVKTSDGYYVLPGVGVKLPNGFVVGTDIKIDGNTDITTMLQPGGNLEYKGFRLAQKLDFKIGDWNLLPKQKEKIEKIGKSLEEITEALPYT